MRLSKTFFYTLRDRPADAEVESHALLTKAGYLQKLAAGIYIYGPFMLRTLQKISQIVREEMNRAGAQELLMPAIQPKEIWVESGRWDRYVKDGILFHFEDRKDAELCLGPTHEEVITTFVKRAITSYRQLPVNLYQIQTKFRDEIRPRFGLMRGREFIMKDAYSFDIDVAGLDKSYQAMYEAYCRIFERCGLKYTVVEADSGAIGGSGSQEFMVNAATGEDAILVCEKGDYAANVEKAISFLSPSPDPNNGKQLEKEKHQTPNIRSVEQLSKFFNGFPANRMAKTIIYKAVYKDKEEPVAVLMRGDLEVNEVKLANALDCLTVQLADDNLVRKATGAEPGFAGPIGLKVKLLADESVRELKNFLCGGNETDVHYLNVNHGRDFAAQFSDLRKVHGGEVCFRCRDGKLTETRGIEVGHIFKLGTKYSKAMGANFTAQDSSSQPFVMGCYGIGVSRIAAAAIEQNHDKNGLIWPEPIAPFRVALIQVNANDAIQKELAEKLYSEINAAGIEVLFDDREASPGVKFKDADLIGIPWQITVGRDAKDGMIEFKERRSGKTEKIAAKDSLARLR